MRPLIPSQRFGVHATKTASRSASPSCRPFPLLAGLHQKKKKKKKRRRTSPESRVVEPARITQRSKCARECKQIVHTEKQQPLRVAKWSSTLSPLSVCLSVPQPPLHTLARPPIGRPLVVAFYVVRGGSSRWEEDGFEKYKVRWAEGEEVQERRVLLIYHF